MISNSIPVRVLSVFFGIGFITVIGFFIFQFNSSKKDLTINFSNSTDVKLIEYRTHKIVGIIEKSGDKIQIQKDIRYKVTYKGADGYDSGALDINSGKDFITISPYYSRKRLDSLLTQQTIDSLHSAAKTEYPNIEDDYSLEQGRLYHFGDWYSTSLTYKKGYDLESDTLSMILKKNGDNWEIAATPNLTLDKFTHSSIPVDILEAINNPSS